MTGDSAYLLSIHNCKEQVDNYNVNEKVIQMNIYVNFFLELLQTKCLSASSDIPRS